MPRYTTPTKDEVLAAVTNYPSTVRQIARRTVGPDRYYKHTESVRSMLYHLQEEGTVIRHDEYPMRFSIAPLADPGPSTSSNSHTYIEDL